MDAKQELTWFIIILVAVGLIWIASGGLNSPTKNSPVIEAVPNNSASSTAEGGGWLSFFFPWSINNNKINSNLTPTGGTISHGKITSGSVSGSVNNPESNSAYGNTYYGADNPPGPAIEAPDTLKIRTIRYSYDQQGLSDGEYIQIEAPSTNKNKMLLTGMLLKSRMTGNQADIGEGVNLYYINSVNQKSPIFLSPGQTAYVITGRSPLGYSFRLNKCIGYMNSYYQNFIVNFSTNCPRVISYPLPARPNALNDTCLDFLKTISSCRSKINFSANLTPECKTFVTDRASYPRCVADFSNDADFLEDEWRVYLGRDASLWKSQREIVDLIDQQGNVVGTYTY